MFESFDLVKFHYLRAKFDNLKTIESEHLLKFNFLF